MEKVFWLMWLSDVVGSISIVGWVATISMGVGCIFLMAVAGIDEDHEMFSRAWRVIRWMLLPVAAAVLTPNQKTIQLLAVSSAVDAAASTQIGAKGLQALNAVLDRVIAGGEPKK